MKTTPWFVYILECSDKSLYTGTTTDIDQRAETHNAGKGAKYTRSRLPVRTVYAEEHHDRSSACKREAEIKSWRRKKKIDLISSDKNIL